MSFNPNKPPKSGCLQCSSYSFIYKTALQKHICLECNACVDSKLVHDLLNSFSKYVLDKLLPRYANLACVSCLENGKVQFKDFPNDCVLCYGCNYVISIYSLHDVMVNEYRTLLIEKTYGDVFKIK